MRFGKFFSKTVYSAVMTIFCGAICINRLFVEYSTKCAYRRVSQKNGCEQDNETKNAKDGKAIPLKIFRSDERMIAKEKILSDSERSDADAQ